MPRSKKHEYPTVDVDHDISETLESLRLKIVAWQAKYGKTAMIRTDGGYNNVSLRVTPSKDPGPQCCNCGKLWAERDDGTCLYCGHHEHTHERRRRERQAIHDRMVRQRPFRPADFVAEGRDA